MVVTSRILQGIVEIGGGVEEFVGMGPVQVSPYGTVMEHVR